MREALARLLALATGLVVLVAALLFSWLRNAEAGIAVAAEPPPVPVSEAASADDAALVARGREVYLAANCAACHAIGGEGNPRIPLDGVGSSLSGEEIRHYTVADPEVAEDLAPRVAAAKKEYQKLPAEDLDALVAYLSSLK
jgi:mono/diheme cytochrome c family protein